MSTPIDWWAEVGTPWEDLDRNTVLDGEAIGDVRAAIADVTLSNNKPVLIQATITESIGADQADEWLQLAEGNGPAADIARARIAWLAGAIAEQPRQ